MVDVGILLDASSSVGLHYPHIKDLVKKLATALGLWQGGTHVGVVRYSTTAKVVIKLNEHNDLRSFYKAVDDIGYTKGFEHGS